MSIDRSRSPTLGGGRPSSSFLSGLFDASSDRVRARRDDPGHTVTAGLGSARLGRSAAKGAPALPAFLHLVRGVGE